MKTMRYQWLLLLAVVFVSADKPKWKSVCPGCGREAISTQVYAVGSRIDGTNGGMFLQRSVMFKCKKCKETWAAELPETHRKKASAVRVIETNAAPLPCQSPKVKSLSKPTVYKATMAEVSAPSLVTIQYFDLTEREHPEAYSDAVVVQPTAYSSEPIWYDGSRYYTNDGFGNVVSCPGPIALSTWSGGDNLSISSPGYTESTNGIVISTNLPGYSMNLLRGKVALIKWKTQPGQFYKLFGSNTVNGPWISVCSKTWIGTGRDVQWFDDGSRDTRFYKVITVPSVNVINPWN